MGRFCKNYFLIKMSKSGRNSPFFFFFFASNFFCKSIRFFACVVYTFFSNMQVANRVASRL